MINLSGIDWEAFYKGLDELQKAIPQPTPAAALTKTEESIFGMTNDQVTQASNLATVVTQAIVQSPQVVDSPANKSPSPQELEQLAGKVISILAPTVAPDLPKDTVKTITNYVATNVSSSPEVKSSPAGVVLTPTQIKSLESDVVKAISGGTQEQAKATIQKVEEAKVSTPASPSTLSQEMALKDAEQKVVKGISGGDEEDVAAAIQAGGIIEDAARGVTSTVVTGPTGPIDPMGTQPTGPIGTQPTGPLGTQPTGPLATQPTGPIGTGPTGAFQTFVAKDGTVFSDFKSYSEYQSFLEGKRGERQSAFDLLFQEFSRYGLGSLVEPLRGLITDPSVSASEFTLRLRGTDAYKKRFAANEKRIGKGLTALNEAEYLSLEDQYQNIMRRYGLPSKYYSKDELGVQSAFENLIASDVSSLELEDRVQTAQERLYNAPPEVMRLLSDFYSGVISNGDALAYILDPENALSDIKRKVTAAEIGAGAAQSGLGIRRERAEQLGAFGVTGEKAQAGFQTVAGGLERGRQLSAIYQQDPYTQEVAETEVFGITGAPEARKRRQKIIKSEEATFKGQTGLTGGALSRDRAGQY
jgi:hypothetical protein